MVLPFLFLVHSVFCYISSVFRKFAWRENYFQEDEDTLLTLRVTDFDRGVDFKPKSASVTSKWRQFEETNSSLTTHSQESILCVSIPSEVFIYLNI